MPKYREAHTFIEQDKFEQAYFIMREWGLTDIALYQLEYPDDKNLLQDSKYDRFWQSNLESLRLPNTPAFRFHPSHNLSDMDCVLGYAFYLLAIQSKEDKDSEKYQIYIEQALLFSSIHAWQTVIHEIIVTPISDITQHCTRLADMLQLLNTRVDRLGTPGYLLMAKAYLHIGLADIGEEDKSRQSSAFQFAFKYFEFARLDEDRSTNDIHNAYFGHGLQTATPFDKNNMEDILSSFHQISNAVLDTHMINYIKNKAISEYRTRHPEFHEDAHHRHSP